MDAVTNAINTGKVGILETLAQVPPGTGVRLLALQQRYPLRAQNVAQGKGYTDALNAKPHCVQLIRYVLQVQSFLA